MPPLTASTSRLASGLHASASAWGSLEVTARGFVAGLGIAGLGVVGGGLPTPGVAAAGTFTLMDSISGPWSGLETATAVPSGLIAIGPSSGPSAIGKACRTLASRFSQYHRPVAKARTATSPPSPGTAPSVKRAVCVGGLVATLMAADGLLRSRESTSYDVQQPTV